MASTSFDREPEQNIRMPGPLLYIYIWGPLSLAQAEDKGISSVAWGPPGDPIGIGIGGIWGPSSDPLLYKKSALKIISIISIWDTKFLRCTMHLDGCHSIQRSSLIERGQIFVDICNLGGPWVWSIWMDQIVGPSLGSGQPSPVRLSWGEGWAIKYIRYVIHKFHTILLFILTSIILQMQDLCTIFYQNNMP